MQLIFWHNLVSPHQAPYMRELALAGHSVTVVAAEAMSEERRRLGWTVPSLGPARVILGPEQGQVTQIVETSGADSVHLIAGARGTALGRQVALACRANGRRMGIVTESPDPRGLRGLLRWTKYAAERLSIGRHFEFILAMGQKGVTWFEHCGYPKTAIFPFAYVTDRLADDAQPEFQDAFRFVFAGQLIPRKGVDVLLRAFKEVPGAQLEIVGEGASRELLHNLASSLGIASRIVWSGKMDGASVQSRIGNADVFILPSREDGWGAVVNEALMAGVPVICSSACGASELIRHPWLGSVFRVNDVTSLTQAMNECRHRGKLSAALRQQIAGWAQCISGQNVARYVEAILHHVYQQAPRPDAPWRATSS